MSAPYPWLDSVWHSLSVALADDRLGHAYLLCGRQGLGKLALAQAWTERLVCEAESGTMPCGKCRGCALIRAGNHPDVRYVQPEEDRKSILIDQVRELIDFYALKSHYHGRKIAVVHPADSMNHAAANALLKLLEEPPPGALLILVAHRPGLLPATIASRCLRLAVPTPGWPERIAWLNEVAVVQPGLPSPDELVLCGAPLAILEQLGSARPRLLNDIIEDLHTAMAGRWDALAAAGRFAEVELPRFLDGLEAVLQGAVLLGAAEQPEHVRLPDNARHQLQEIANKLNSKRLLLYLDGIAEARGAAQRSSGVRGAELIESLWLAWRRMTLMETKA